MDQQMFVMIEKLLEQDPREAMKKKKAVLAILKGTLLFVTLFYIVARRL